MASKPIALQIADALEKNGDGCTCCAYASFECCCNAVWGSDYTREAATEIRRLHEENVYLRDVYQSLVQDRSELFDDLDKAVAAEREKVAAWMRSKSYATGHGDTIEDLLKELEWQVAEREREACAKVCEKEQFELTQDVAGKNGLQHFDAGCRSCAEMIRARGET